MNKQKKVQNLQIKIRITKPTKSVIIYLLAWNEFKQSNEKKEQKAILNDSCSDDIEIFCPTKKQRPKCFHSFFFFVFLWCSTLNFQPELNDNKYLFLSPIVII